MVLMTVRVMLIWTYFMFHFLQGARQYAKEIGAIFTETSALTAVNVGRLFEDIGNILFVCCTYINSKMFSMITWAPWNSIKLQLLYVL